jgi:AcrR family transcriptional regulator
MSYEGSIVVGGVDYGKRLPRGRHGIPQDLIVANQRARLHDATAAVFAEEGYAALSVSSVIERAGVSRATFYKLFDGKLDCVLAAQAHTLDRLDEVISDACSRHRDWPRAVEAAAGAGLSFAARHPADAQLILASAHAPSEPQLTDGENGIDRRLLERLREGARPSPSTRSPGDLIERAAVGAVISLVATYLAAGKAGALPELRPSIVQILLAPYLGVNEARRVALDDRPAGLAF